MSHRRSHAKQIDVILISHGDMDHLGALVYAVKTFGIQCPVSGPSSPRRAAHRVECVLIRYTPRSPSSIWAACA